MKKLLTFTALAMALVGCASTGTIAPQYINPTTYQAYDCQALQNEVARVSKLAQTTKNQNIPLSTGLGVGIAAGRGGIYPTISLGTGVGGGRKQAKINTLSRLYGEHDAMIVAARQKGCQFAQNVKIYGE